jgi:conjugative transfer signal peptidase TraF
MRRSWLVAALGSGAFFAGLFGVLAALEPQPRLIWNASASVPVGLYRVDVDAIAAAGDLVAVNPPAGVAALLARRGYLPRGVPLLKRLAGAEGALVCRSGVFITIDGTPAARARTRDRAGRPLPIWLGCRRLQRGEIFLLGSAADSFDGRYFGPISASGLIGTLHPLLTSAAPDAPFRWRPDRSSPAPTSYAKEQ